MAAHELTRVEARRIAIRAQLLDRPQPTSLLEVVRRLTLLQADQTAAVAPSADLVLWSRLGSSYRPDHLESALGNQALLEVQGMIRPAEDLALYRADMADWPGRGELLDWQRYRRDWVAANRGCRLDILSRLRSDGPLPARELPDTCEIPWSSSGWSNDRNVLKMLELLEAKGEVAMAGRDGRERLWDLAERIHPDDRVVAADEAARIRAERRLRSLGIARVSAAKQPAEPVDGVEVGEPAVVEGVRGRWLVDPLQLGQPFSGRAVLLSPLDRLVFDRKRMTDLFGFDYQLEMYKPAAKRRWGYWAMPILYGNQLVGKLDATADRRAGVLRVDAVHQDVAFTKAMAAAIDREIADLAAWLGLNLDLPSR
ncbi:DNA glycosylase AlkZ-like family protein [Catellatospora tritici]|uniref:DNA glycosylase AlkZ-like family protein n=1 Tax=Catellatospora tritici TaxID=2851566 RepID=UPI001C2CDB90|nr:crosslink repair DNA glycosylase YcaQ family protein [Catellatospora tritici]MBV1850618.1 winged helix DNA-binding domain-containing protein [Catellatospora tritici]